MTDDMTDDMDEPVSKSTDEFNPDWVFTELSKAYSLLERCEVEMRYAGWDAPVSDNHARESVFKDVKEFLGG